MNAVVFFVFCFSILPERKKNKLFCCIFITALVNDHFRPCRKIDAENLTPPKKKEEKSQLACGTAVLSYSFIFIHTLSLSKNNDSAFVTGSLLSMTTHSPRRREIQKEKTHLFSGMAFVVFNFIVVLVVLISIISRRHDIPHRAHVRLGGIYRARVLCEPVFAVVGRSGRFLRKQS